MKETPEMENFMMSSFPFQEHAFHILIEKEEAKLKVLKSHIPEMKKLLAEMEVSVKALKRPSDVKEGRAKLDEARKWAKEIEKEIKSMKT